MPSRFSIIVVFAVGIFADVTSADAQVVANSPPTLRSKPRAMSQKSGEGEAKPLSRLAPLNFDVDNLELSEIRTDAEYDRLRNALLLRRQNLQTEVDKALAPNGAGKLPLPGDIIKTLQDTFNSIKDDDASRVVLKRDLDRLLIAALVSVDKNGTQPSTKTWSYRRLRQSVGGTSENWGPTIETHPDRILFIPVLNLLDRDELKCETIKLDLEDSVPTGTGTDGLTNAPKEFDVINLHTHGLNVSPKWPSDNIFRKIYSRQLKFYIYHIPYDQPAGTYYYHPHNHGSVATQVAGGMAGPLIVRDKKRGLDKLGNDSGWPAETETILMFQQLTLFQNEPGTESTQFTRPDFFALKDMEPWTGGAPNQCENCAWVEKCQHERAPLAKLAKILLQHDPDFPNLKRLDIQTWVSGQFKPDVSKEKPMALGEVRRFRLIHAGVEENINFAIKLADSSDIKNTDAPDPLIQLIAWDGIPLEHPYLVTDNHPLIISPGNRADVLVTFPPRPWKTLPAKIAYSILQRDKSPGNLNDFASLVVDTTLPVMNGKFVSDTDAATIFCQTAPTFYPVQSPNTEAFNLEFGDAQVDADGNFTPGTFTIDNLALAVVKGESGHPLHIHVNPFLVSEDANRAALGLPTNPYWSDTILIPVGQAINVTMPFHLWTGRSVSHCHILDHEDAGMMNLIEIQTQHHGLPEVTLPGVLDLVRIPKAVHETLRSAWPKPDAPVSSESGGRVSIYVFMPGLLNGDTCPHCSETVKKIAMLREKLPNPEKVRLIVVSGTDRASLPSNDALKLNEKFDVLCDDKLLKSFQYLGLIDGTPILDKQNVMTFPGSFDNGGKIRFPYDVMHGLFIVSPDGFVISSRRDFTAFDDVDQILAEVQIAGGDSKLIADRYVGESKKFNEGSSVRKQLESQGLRFQQRHEKFIRNAQ